MKKVYLLTILALATISTTAWSAAEPHQKQKNKAAQKARKAEIKALKQKNKLASKYAARRFCVNHSGGKVLKG